MHETEEDIATLEGFTDSVAQRATADITPAQLQGEESIRTVQELVKDLLLKLPPTTVFKIISENPAMAEFLLPHILPGLVVNFHLATLDLHPNLEKEILRKKRERTIAQES